VGGFSITRKGVFDTTQWRANYVLRVPSKILDLPQLRPYKDAMKTLTVTEARKNLSGWIRRAEAGKEIAIIDGARIHAIREVKVMAADYALAEYGATPADVDGAVGRSRHEIAAERAAGYLTAVFPDEDSVNPPRRRTNRRSADKHPR